MRSFLVTVSFLIGCSDYNRPDEGLTREQAEQACLDTADAYGDMCARCFPADPSAYSSCYDAILQGVNGSCRQVVNVRDVEELYNQCLPWTEQVSCAALSSPTFALDSSCQGQLLLE
jgi:hypothetical protein